MWFRGEALLGSGGFDSLLIGDAMLRCQEKEKDDDMGLARDLPVSDSPNAKNSTTSPGFILYFRDLLCSRLSYVSTFWIFPCSSMLWLPENCSESDLTAESKSQTHLQLSHPCPVSEQLSAQLTC
jgi:hypothetical protein